MKVKELCIICHHSSGVHEHRELFGKEERLNDICWDCDDGCWDKYHTFKLDNLYYIETLAKQKGLI